MGPVRYFLFVLFRLSEALLLASGVFGAAWWAEERGWLPMLVSVPASWNAPLRGAVLLAIKTAQAAAAALTAHVLVGAKQRAPVFRRYRGALFAFAGIPATRAAGCRGGFVTGSTGSGKTLSCILPRLHSMCINNPGAVSKPWTQSREGRRFLRSRRLRQKRIDSLRRRILGLSGRGKERERLLQALASERLKAARAADQVRPRRFQTPPWGGLVCGEKGNEARTIEKLLRRHGREEDLRILRTRGARPAGEAPSVRLNLLCVNVAADTLARILVDTSLCVEGAETRDEFFVPQARDKIAWAIRLMRSVHEADPDPRRPAPGLTGLLEILTLPQAYHDYLAQAQMRCPSLESVAAYASARHHLEEHYWNQPAEQLGGVRSTLHNFLSAYCEPQIAEVFCTDSTFDLEDVCQGIVLCLAIPQSLAHQRRYVSTVLKSLVYQVIIERFDTQPSVAGRSVVLVEQDEWQRHAVEADCDVDVVREAGGAVYAAAQSQNAVWRRLGGKDRASPLIANLRNRWICQAATAECAEESASLLGNALKSERSHAHGPSGSTTTVTIAERPVVPASRLRNLPPFHVVYAPAEGPFLYRIGIAMPVTPEGEIPHWWFGDWNPFRWAARWAGLPTRFAGIALHRGEGMVPPWRASAPRRAILRWLAGIDGTFITVESRRRGNR